jgi:hypothetical protein
MTDFERERPRLRSRAGLGDRDKPTRYVVHGLARYPVHDLPYPLQVPVIGIGAGDRRGGRVGWFEASYVNPSPPSAVTLPCASLLMVRGQPTVFVCEVTRLLGAL